MSSTAETIAAAPAVEAPVAAPAVEETTTAAAPADDVAVEAKVSFVHVPTPTRSLLRIA